MTNNTNGTVSVLLNTTPAQYTTPRFATQQTFATGGSPQYVAAGDINADGTMDLVVANFNDQTVSVLLNTTVPGATTASFAPQQTFATGGTPGCVLLADFNADGAPDVAAVNEDTYTVSVLLNTTQPGALTPNFAASQIFSAGSYAKGMTAGDVNGDGRADLAVTNYASDTAEYEFDTVSVLLNTTPAGSITATFASPSTFATGRLPWAVSLADLDTDGRPDLVVSNRISDSISVLLNATEVGAPTATFASQEVFAAYRNPQGLAVADFNTDGKPDVAASNYNGNSVSVLLNAPPAASAAFAPQQTFVTGSRPRDAAVGDFNADGKVDLAVTNTSDDTVSVLLNATATNASTPAFAAQQTFATGDYPAFVAVADFDADGKLDLAVTNEGSNSVSVLLNTTPPGALIPSFAPQVTFTTGTRPEGVAVGDFNGDSKADLAVVNQLSHTVSVLLNMTEVGAAMVTFAPQSTFATAGGSIWMSVADFNADGKPDLVIGYGVGTASLLRNTTPAGSQTATFADRQSIAAGTGTSYVAVGDFNADERPDLAGSDSSGTTVSVLLNTTTAGASACTFTTALTFGTQTAPCYIAVIDLNADGKPDLAAMNGSCSTVSVLLSTTPAGSAVASFGAQRIFPTGRNPWSMVAADFNADGKPDLAVANSSDDTVSVLLNAYATATATILNDDPIPTPTSPAAYFLRQSPTHTTLELYPTSTYSGTPLLTQLLTAARPILIPGSPAADSLTLDFANGNPLPFAGLTFNAAAGLDSLILSNVTANTCLSLTPTQLLLNTTPITFSNLESIELTAPTDVTLSSLSLAPNTALKLTTSLRVTALTLAPTATLDLADSDLVIDSPDPESTYATLLPPPLLLAIKRLAGPRPRLLRRPCRLLRHHRTRHPPQQRWPRFPHPLPVQPQ